MKLVVRRIYKGDTYTIGNLYIDGTYFCDTLEDKDRGLKDSMTVEEIKKIKVNDETAIPTGTYQVSINIVSPKYSNYTKYSWAKDIGGKVPRLLNVKGFDGILVHLTGNKSSETSGCLLLGFNKVRGQVINSQETFKKLYPILQEANNKGEAITITIE